MHFTSIEIKILISPTYKTNKRSLFRKNVRTREIHHSLYVLLTFMSIIRITFSATTNQYVNPVNYNLEKTEETKMYILRISRSSWFSRVYCLRGAVKAGSFCTSFWFIVSSETVLDGWWYL